MDLIQSFQNAVDAPRVLSCERDINLKPGIRYGPVIRDVYIFECCASGCGSVIINGNEFSVKAGDFYILLPGDTVVHTADIADPRSGAWCVADGKMIGNYISQAGISSTHPFAPVESFAEAYAQMEIMLKMTGKTDVGSDLRRSSCLYNILASLFKDHQNADKESIIKKSIGIMEARYSEVLTIQDLADAVGLERSYFSTFFKQSTGIPPHQYLTQLRIQKACVLMERWDLSISETAESVGLDPQNFARIFKREMGITPLQYRHGKR